ncbi:10902_t:CDS:2, partial [Gigaspora rosea]
HKTQGMTHPSKNDTEITPSDLKSTNPSQSSIFVDPKFTFFAKLLEKKRQREDQHNINSEMDKILPPQSVQPIPSFSEIPIEFLNLLELEIFNKFYPNNIFNTNSTPDRGSKKPLEYYDISKAFQRNSIDKLNLAYKTTKNVICNVNLSGYKHVFKPQYFKNTLGETIVDFYTLPNPVTANNAKAVVDYYYQHICNNPLHQSKEFAKKMAETFGAFTVSWYKHEQPQEVLSQRQWCYYVLNSLLLSQAKC